MAKNILFVMVTWLVLGASAMAAPDIVELALTGIGTGSGEEIKERIKTTSYTYTSPQFRAQTVAALPGRIRNQMVTFGLTLRRAEKALAQVLALYGRTGTVELILYKSEIPHATLWRNCVLAISDGLAGPLTDAALLGIIAHELAHTYFMDELRAARRADDVGLMKVVELKCDAVAYLTLKLLGLDPASYLTGIKRVKGIMRGMSLSGGLEQTHPEVHERAQFLERFVRQLGW